MLGIIAPSEDELEPIIGLMRIEKSEIAAQAMIDRYDPEPMALRGVAGSLDGELRIGDVVVGKEIRHHDVSGEILTEYHPWMEEDLFRSDGEHNTSCVDMESAAFAQVCRANGKRFIVVRSITDYSDDAGPSCFEANVKACSRNAAEVLRLALSL